MTSTGVMNNNSKIGASSANFDIRNHIDQLTPNKKEKGKYICPACNGHNLSIDLKTGQYKCWNCGDTQAIKAILAPKQQVTRQEKAPRPKKTTHYNYPDRQGNPLVRVVRIDDGSGKKQIFQQHWNGQAWVKGYGPIKTTDIPLYRYAEVMEAITRGEPIILCEGESTADAFWDKGIPATTTIGGTGKTILKDKDGNVRRNDKTFESIKPALADLIGSQVILSPDQDKPGCLHMEMMAEILNVKGWLYPLPQSFQWSRLPNKGGLDFVDWIHDYPKLTREEIMAEVKPEPIHVLHLETPNYHSARDASTLTGEIDNPPTAIELDSTEKLKTDILAYLLEKDPYARATIKTHILRSHGISRETLEGLVIETAIGSQSKQLSIFSGAQFLNSDIEPVQFLVQGVPIGGTTILAGSSGSGKTTLAYWLGKCVLDGNEFLGDTPSTTGGIIIVNSDEGASTSLDRMIDMSYPEDDRWMFLQNFKLDYHFEQLEELVRDRQPKLLIVDSFCGIHGEAFEENNSLAGLTIEKFNQLAQHYGCAVVMIHHLNKVDELRGSSRIKDIAHSVLQIKENKDGTRDYCSKKVRCASSFEYTLKLNEEGIPIICQGGESKMHLNIKEIILGCLLASTTPLEPIEIANLTQLSHRQVLDGLKKLRDTGKAKCRRSQRDKRAKVWSTTVTPTHTHPLSKDESHKMPETITEKEIEPSKKYETEYETEYETHNNGKCETDASLINYSPLNPSPGKGFGESMRPLTQESGESDGAECDSPDHQQQEKVNPAAEYYTLKSGDFVFGNNKLFQLQEKSHNMWLTVQGIYVSYADWLAGSFRKPTSNDVKFLLCQVKDKLQLEFLVKHFQSVVMGQLLEELPQSVSEQILDLDWD